MVQKRPIPGLFPKPAVKPNSDWRSSRHLGPYPGLRPFRSDEAHLFFGREEQTDDLLRRLKNAHFLAIIGSSGCGKSSLVKAGLIAALETGFMGSEGPLWLPVQMRPGNQPMRTLAKALIDEAGLVPSNGDQDMATGLLLAYLRRGPLGLVEAFRFSPLYAQPEKGILAQSRDDPLSRPVDENQDTPKPAAAVRRRNLLVLVDQFEEIFRFSQQGGIDEAVAFVALLLRTAHEAEVQNLPIYVVITMRSDFIGDCAYFDGLPEALNRSQYLTPRLHREQLKQAIVGPARVYGSDVEPQLATLLLNEIGNDQDQLPILQHLLMRMWTWRNESGTSVREKLTLDDYHAVGGLQNALSQHADEALNSLDDDHRRIAETMFRQLSELGEDGRAVRRPTEAQLIAEIARTTLIEVKKVVDVFRAPGVSFIMPSGHETLEPNAVLDISHESLIRQWTRLRDWAEAEAESAQKYRDIWRANQLYDNKQGELWFGNALSSAVQWREQQQPTEGWAAQVYGKREDLHRILDFIKKSEEEEQAKAARKKEERKKRLRIWQYASLACFVCFVVAASMAWWAIETKRDFAEQRARVVAKSAEREMESGNRRVAILAALDALPDPDALTNNPVEQVWRWINQPPVVPDAVRALERALYTPAGRTIEAADPLMSARFLTKDILTVFGEESVYRIDLRTGKSEPLGLDVDFDFSSSFSMDGRYMLTANKVGKASIWDLQDGKELVQWNAVDVRGRFVTAFGPKGKVATSSFLEDDVKIWSWSVGSTDKPRLEGVLEVPKVAREEEEELGLRINSVAFDHTGERVATTSWIGITSIWDTKSRKRLDVLKMDDPIWGATFSPDGSQLVLISRKNAFLWDRDFGKLLKPLIGGGQEIRSAQFSPDGKRIVTSSSDGIAAIWNSANGGLVREFRGPTRAYGRHTAAVFSPDGGRTAAVFSTPSAFVWEVNRPRGVFNVCQLSPYAANVTAFDVDQDNQRVVTAFDRSVNVRECASGRTAPVPLADTFDGAVGTFSPPIMAVAFDPSDPEDTRILTASGDHVEIWDRTTGRRISVIKGHSSLVLAAAYDRQGQRVVTGSQDKSARIWDAKSGEERLSLPHDAAVFAVAFSPDGQHVVTADADQTLRVWDAVEGDLQKSAELERWPYLVEFVDNERVFVIAAPPFVWTCADSACDNPWSTQRFELWEWRLSGHHQPVPFSNNDDVGLSTAGHNIRVGQEDHNIVLTPKKAEDAASARHPAKARLLLPAMEAAIKFVFPNQDSKRLTAVSRKGEVQMVVVPPNNWADLVRDAKKTVGSWDDVQQELTEEERRRLGLEIAE